MESTPNHAELKAILRKLLEDIEDLRASQVAIATLSGQAVPLGNALSAKNQAAQEQRSHYDKLRKEIDALP